jgi:hypothetical protein
VACAPPVRASGSAFDPGKILEYLPGSALSAAGPSKISSHLLAHAAARTNGLVRLRSLRGRLHIADVVCAVAVIGTVCAP